MKTVRIKWIDSAAWEHGWADEDEHKSLKPITVESVGILVENNDDYVIIAHSYDSDNDSYHSPIAISSGCIVELRHE